MMRISILLGVVLAVAIGCAASPPSPAPPASPPGPASPPPAHACTEIGCTNGFALALQPNASWPAGKYTFEITSDGRITTCTGALPLPACDSGPALSCSGPGVRIGESGCALAPDAHGFSDIAFDGAPKQVQIRVVRDGTELVNRSFQPAYRRLQPNGPGCPPVCDNAHADLRVL